MQLTAGEWQIVAMALEDSADAHDAEAKRAERRAEDAKRFKHTTDEQTHRRNGAACRQIARVRRELAKRIILEA
jgi:hypothetical protein